MISRLDVFEVVKTAPMMAEIEYRGYAIVRDAEVYLAEPIEKDELLLQIQGTSVEALTAAIDELWLSLAASTTAQIVALTPAWFSRWMDTGCMGRIVLSAVRVEQTVRRLGQANMVSLRRALILGIAALALPSPIVSTAYLFGGVVMPKVFISHAMALSCDDPDVQHAVEDGEISSSDAVLIEKRCLAPHSVSSG